MNNRLTLTGLMLAAVFSMPGGTPVDKGATRPGILKAVPMRSVAQARQVAVATPLDLPAYFSLSTKEEIESYTTVDGNADGKTWKYESGYPTGSACCEGTATLDDWLVLPAVNFTAPGGSYSLTLEAKQLVKPETFEICLSPTPDVTDAFVVYTCAAVPNINFGQLNADFTVATPGAYYVMVHGTSDPVGLSLNIKNLQITVNAPQTFTVPFEMVPEADEAKYFTFIDANDDGKCWKYDTSNKGLSYENAANTVDADDYALFPEVVISEPGNYKFSLDANGYGYGANQEGLEILFGRGDDPSQFTKVFTDRAVSAPGYRRQVVMAVQESGLYRVCLHAVSPASAYKMLVKNFKLEATDEQPACALPLQQNELAGIDNSEVFSRAFVLPASPRVKISFEVQGAPVNVGIGNAPVSQACSPLFSTVASDDFTQVTQVINLNREGINYLRFAGEGSTQLRNLRVEQFTEEDEAYQLPFAMQPTALEFNQFAVVNSNADESTWSYYELFGAARYNWSNTAKADDWLILPAINVPDKEHMLRFSLKARGMAVSLPETFEVWAGKTADPAEMTKLYTSPEVRTEEFTPFSFSFSPQWTGLTYLAVRATSEPKMFHLFVRDFTIEAEQRTTSIPRPAEELTAVAEPVGALMATVSFKMPTLTEGGDLIPTDSSLKATIETPADQFNTEGRPGATCTLKVATQQGVNEILVIIANNAGASNPAATTVYTGQDKPAAVEQLALSASEDNRSVHITWQQPEAGMTGRYVDPSQVTYTVRHAIGSNSYTNAGRVTGTCEFDYTIPASYPLEMHYFIIVPSNVAGEGDPGKGSGIVLGRPHSIPAVEEMNGAIELGPVGMSNPDASYTLDWYYDNPAKAFDEAANASGYALVAFTGEPGVARGRLHLPKFDTRTDKGARLILRLFNYPHFAPTDVYGLTHEGTPVFISRIEPSAEAAWLEYSLPMPSELMNRQWVEVYLDFGFDGTHDDEIWMLDRYGMAHYFDRELEVRPLLAPTAMKAQESARWRFSASNYGREDIAFPMPELHFTTPDGDVCGFHATQSGAEVNLHPGESVTLDYDVNLDVVFEGTVAYDLAIPVEGDGNPDNNYAAGEVTVRMQSEFVVRDLHAERDDSGEVHLTWSPPAVDAYGMYYVDNLESWDYSSQLGLFTNYDADGLPTMRFVGASYPGMGAPKAWQVWDYVDAGFDVTYAGYLGTTKSLIVFGPGDGATPADDWLISPEVKGGTMLTFYVRPLHFAYGPETIEILTSSTRNTPSDFSLLTTFRTQEGDKDKIPYWEEVEAMLPESTRFFAIRYVSRDVFGLQLDDIIYTPAQSETSDLTYTVLRDGEPIATGLTQTSYTDCCEQGAIYHVAAEKAYGGLHPLSNRAMTGTTGVQNTEAGMKVTTSAGMLTIAGANGALTVSATDGTIIYTTQAAPATLQLSLSPGVYLMVAQGKAALKVMVP